MAVRVRLFAALRDAAGTAEEQVAPGRLPDVLDELCRRHGELFCNRLSASAVLLDGDTVHPADEIDVPDGSELALLPPVSGGAAVTARVPGAAVTLAAVVVLAATAAAGRRPFAVVVVAVSALALVGLVNALGRAGPRPVLIAAAVAGVGAPLRLLLDPDAGLDSLAGLMVAMVLVAFVLLTISPRRHGVTGALAATFVAGLTVGLGAGALVALRSGPRGFRWAVALLALVTVPELAAAVAARLGPGGAAANAARVVAAAAVAGALLAVVNPPLTLTVTVAILAVCMAGAFAARLWGAATAAEAETVADPSGWWLVGLFLAAPAVLLVATAVQR